LFGDPGRNETEEPCVRHRSSFGTSGARRFRPLENAGGGYHSLERMVKPRLDPLGKCRKHGFPNVLLERIAFFSRLTLEIMPCPIQKKCRTHTFFVWGRHFTGSFSVWGTAFLRVYFCMGHGISPGLFLYGHGIFVWCAAIFSSDPVGPRR
jgi:hypothetical protein